MDVEQYIISEEAEEQFKVQQKYQALGVPELTHREKVTSLRSAKRIIESTKVGIRMFLCQGILFLAGGLTMVSFGDAWIGGWSKVFWLIVVYGSYHLLIALVGFTFFFKTVLNRPDRVFIEESGQAIHRGFTNYGLRMQTLKVGKLDKE